MQTTNIENERGNITTGLIDIKRRMMENYKQPYPHKFGNLGKINKFLKDTNY